MSKTKKKKPVQINRIKVILAEKGMSQQELADKLKRTKNLVSLYCNNHNQPKMNFLPTIAKALGCTMKDIIA